MTVRNAVDDAFEQARAESRAVLIPYLTAGFPEPDAFVELAVAVIDAGADILEIGIPFSDPLLDGAAIQRSSQCALELGVTPPKCLDYARQIHEQRATPLLFMTPYNPLLAYGLERFCADAAPAGVAGLIVTDVPLEEQADLRAALATHNLHLIQLLAPTSPQERLERAARAASGFIYCISVAGVTGARRSVAATARPPVEAVKRYTDVPVAVGFGISGPAPAAEVAEFADGVIVGSALINLLAEAESGERMPRVQSFISDLRGALAGQTVS